MRTRLRWCLAAAAVAWSVSPLWGAEFFVAPAGSDANPGTRQQPFGTLHRARQAVRGMRRARPAEPVTVWLEGGTYYLAETLVLAAADSGSKDAPVAWRAIEGHRPVISGGVRLDLAWEPHAGGVRKARVPAGLTFDQLFVDGRRQPMARYPNFDPTVRHFNGYAADAFSPERAARWSDPRGGFIHAMHVHEWGDFHYVITGKGPEGKVRYEGGWQNNRRMGMHGTFRMVENVREELDAPGEWFFDAKAGLLYYFAPPGLELAGAAVEVVRLRHLVELRGSAESPVRFLAMEGLTFRHAARTFMDNKEPLLRSDWTIYRGGAVLLAGTEDCTLENCLLDQLGGNAVFVSGYNRRVAVRGCHVAGAGASGVAFVGDPGAVRSPLFECDERQGFDRIDRTPGPKSPDYPADCLVEDCLIHETGRVEKQTAPVQIAMARAITVRHCSIYDVPRAGINIGDGCWGGHVIEHCDIFDTVKETGDHGSFNSWGRDRYWGLSGIDLNAVTLGEHKGLPLLDAAEPVVLRNNRWRCDHGWDIDLDDGSTNYELRNNLCLNGGIKLREGFYRVCENNVMVNNSFHPHVWFRNSQDVFRRNVVFAEYRPIGVSTPWGKQCDDNLLHRPGQAEPKPAAGLRRQSGLDAHSLEADAAFEDPASGDYRVKAGSAALKLGFQNFPMDRFGVRSPRLRALARTPELPGGPSGRRSARRSPFADAVAVWHMADREDSAGKNSRLTPSGDVKLGVALAGAEREASLSRGGDGSAAEFRGGWLAAGHGADGELTLAGKAMTLCVRLRDPSGKWDSPLLARHGGHPKLTYNLFSADLGSGMVLGFELGTDFGPRPLRLLVPLRAIGPADWHDVVVRYRGPKLEMFVDGVLVDEEWPAGSLRPDNGEPCLIGAESYGGRVKPGFHGLIDHAALWGRALSDEEIVELSGGKDAVARRQKEILGEASPSMQYWKPPGHNTSVGDCMPFYHDGTFHLFYLFDRRHHGSKFGLGAHQWAHASSRDLVRWVHHPMAIPITEEREASICTGSVFFHEGTYYAYYATRMADGSGERLSLATSPDGVRFQKTLPNPFAGPEKGYGPRDYRDPNVFQDPRSGLFHMLVAARLADARGGCLAQLVSRDLRDWKLAEPFLVTGHVPECPDHFAWNGRYYLISTGYWTSPTPTGPWTKPALDALDVLYVPKTAAFTGNRRIYVSWLPQGGWGGCAVFRELIQHPDGTLGTKFPAEMIPATGDPVRLRPETLPEGASRRDGSIAIQSRGTPAQAVLTGMPRNVRLTARVNPSPGAAVFGLRLGVAPGQKGSELRFAPPQRRVQIAGGPAIEQVGGLDRPFGLDLILKDDVLDVCVDGRRTLVGRVSAERGDGLALFAENGQAAFEKIEVRPLR